MMNCSLDFFLSAVREEDSYIDFHSHAGFEIVYYASGSGTTSIGNETYAYGSGDFTIIPAGQMHDEYSRQETHVMFVGFFYDGVPVRLPAGIYRDDADSTVRKLLEKMAKELYSKHSFYHIKLHCILTELIIEVSRMIGIRASNETAEVNEKLVYAKNYMDQYFSEKIDFTDLAASLGYSYHYFRHQFKEKTGYPPIQYVISKRIDQAKRLLRDSSHPMTLIAMECGFSTPSQFSTLFKKHVGISPNQYRHVVQGE